MKNKAIEKTANPSNWTWTFASPKDWSKWIKTQAALSREKVKLNIIICPSI